jgi:predicted  nucleic acid-binding Zn-ribbon protein
VFAKEVASLTEQVSNLQSELETTKVKQAEAEKEQEDLLVLLEEISSKRKADRARMREAGMEVSEDEDDEDAGDEGEEDEGEKGKDG